MRLLFLTNFFPPHDIGGYEQWCLEVAMALHARGHQLAVLTSRLSRPRALEAPPPLDQGGLKVARTLFLESDLDYYEPMAFFFRRARQERRNVEQLHRTIEAFNPDAILVWNMWNLSRFVAYHAEQLMPGRVGYFISNYWPTDVDAHTAYWSLPTRRAGLAPLKRLLGAAVLARLRKEGYPPRLQFKHAVCCSQYVRGALTRAGALPATAGVVLGGTEPAPFLARSALARPTPSDVVRLLYFGRLIHDKGVHTALEAIGQLANQGRAERVALTILGSGHPEYEQRLRHMCAQLGLESKVRFVKQVPRDEIPTWLGEHDVFLFTSIWPEPMARSVMEAMAAGLLVIGSNVGGQAEMLQHGHNALTFQAGDAGMLARQIAAIVDDPVEMRRLARAGQQMVSEKFTLDRMAGEIERFVEAMTAPA